MKKTLTLVLMISAILAFTSCDRKDRKDLTMITENIENAKTQLSSLLSEAKTPNAEGTGDTLRIPSSYKDGIISYVPIDDWVSGFFAGELWYMYELTGDEAWAQNAEEYTEVLDSIQYLTWHHDVGFMVYDSFGNGLRLKNIEKYKQVILNTAKSLSTRFRPNAGVLQSWNVDRGWQSERGWKCPVIIDNMMNLELLFKATEMSGDSTYYKIAVSHADKTMDNHFREDHSCYHVIDYDPETGEVLHKCTAQGYSDDSAWARGQAWALYGYTVAYRFTKDESYLRQAENVDKFIFGNKNMPEDLVPYWDFDAPNAADGGNMAKVAEAEKTGDAENTAVGVTTAGKTDAAENAADGGNMAKATATYRDASAAAIIASALYELYSLTDKKAYMDKADKIITSLSSPAYRAAKGTNGGFILMHSVGSIPHGSSIDVPLNYADYYFLEALSRKKNLIEKGSLQ